jgi:hypothetical protein
MATARVLIKRTLQLIGVIGQGESLPASDANDTLTALNDMLGSWSAQGNAVYEEAKDIFTLTGAASYTIGVGATINTPRPVRIVAAFTRSGGHDYPLTLKDQKFYASICDKDTSGYPEYLYYDGGYPNGTLYLSPKPQAGLELHLYSQKPLISIASLDTEITLPPGYDRAIRYNLACERAPEYGIEPSRQIKTTAYKSKKIIDNANRLNDEDLLRVDTALLHNDSFDIYRGY